MKSADYREVIIHAADNKWLFVMKRDEGTFVHVVLHVQSFYGYRQITLHSTVQVGTRPSVVCTERIVAKR